MLGGGRFDLTESLAVCVCCNCSLTRFSVDPSVEVCKAGSVVCSFSDSSLVVDVGGSFNCSFFKPFADWLFSPLSFISSFVGDVGCSNSWIASAAGLSLVVSRFGASLDLFGSFAFC